MNMQAPRTLGKRGFRLGQIGQGMTEYIIIVALVAIAAIAVYSFFGKTVRGQMASITSQLAGNGGIAGNNAAASAASKANVEASNQYNLKNYKSNAADASQTGG